MRIFKFIISFICFLSLLSFKTDKITTDDSEKIIGVWFTDDKTSKIQIYKLESQYFGKIIWLAPKATKEDLKVKPNVGYQIFRKFVFEGKNVWSGGQVSDPRSGMTVSGKMTLKNENTLNVRGYVGSPIFGKTVILIRAE
ncbi:MAG: DUF2147 domain-containing protein [Bacteroidota bacterium]|jgi:uncharacterized protein (DUF2147 family)